LPRDLKLAAIEELLRRMDAVAFLLVLAEFPLADHPGDLDLDATIFEIISAM